MSMENLEKQREGKAEAVVEKRDQVLLCPLQISHRLAWDETRASAVKDLGYGTACCLILR
jgi:hypothetical protein